jgi:GTP-binding protein EngB required for normal cell division
MNNCESKRIYDIIRRKLKKLKHATIGSSKPKPVFLFNEAQPKLDAIEQIRADLKAENIEVPGIVVAGAQSAGKSSLLESLSNVNLPSGENITTRVPLILRLEHKANVSERYALIGDNPDLETFGTKVKNLENLPSKIVEITNRIAGNSGCVVDKPIHVKVISNDCPTMTLIDLPGITHLSVNDEQEDIHTATVNLVKKYISSEQMIILCVIPAVDDFANSEAIKFAKVVDPTGKRTLGVVTKVDLCKTDTKIGDKLRGEGNNVKLDLGFVAVRNRSPDDIHRGTSIAKLREIERTFFETSTHFIGVDKQYWGINTLIKRINELQMKSIDTFIPKIKLQLTNAVNELKLNYQHLAPEFHNDVQKIQHMLKIIISVVSQFKSLAKSVDDCMDDKHLHVSPRTYEMYTRFAEKLKNAQPDFESEEFSQRVKTAIEESKCIMLFNFMSHVAFNQLYIETHIAPFRSACDELIDEVHMYVKSVMDVIIDTQLQMKYPPLILATKLVVEDFLNEQKTSTQEVVNKLIEAELFIFTQNVEYPIKVKSIDSADAVEFLQKALKVYSDIAISRFCDCVPMQCHLFFVTKLYKTLHEYVDLEIMSHHLIDDTIVVNKRKETELSISRFEKALTILNELKL